MATPAQLSPVTDVIAVPCPCGVAGDIAAFHLVPAKATSTSTTFWCAECAERV